MSDKIFTPEELNYFRVCYITSNIIRDGLQSVFKEEWDRIHGCRLGPWEDTAKNGQDLFAIESTRSRNKNKRYLNIIQNGNTSEWDCACFFVAILFSDSLGPFLRPTIATNVDDLRGFRNGVFAHLAQARISESEFQANVQQVLDAFKALNLDTNELQNISNQGSFPTGEIQKLQEQISVLEEEIHAKPKSFMLLPLKPSHEVTERSTEVEDIMQKFVDLQNEVQEHDSTVTIYASGNPGCGKSLIAREVGKKFYDKNVKDSNQESPVFVMTLNAESEESMLDSYKKFARELGITEYSLNTITGADSKLKPDEKIAHLKTHVSAKSQNYASWLLIFDNANDLKSIRSYFPDEDWGGCGCILVTTQDSTNLPFADPFCRHVSLSQGMQANDGLCLLRSICQFSCDDEEDEHSVLKALDYQPLAIASAALYVRYLREAGGPSPFTWKSYLKKLETGKRKCTEKVYERTSKSYPLSMTSAVSLALQKLVQNHVFENVVHFLALCAPAPVGLDMIVSFVTKQDPDLDEDMAAAEISKCSLLMQLPSEDSSRTLIKMHQVVHDVFKSYLFDKQSNEKVSMITLSYIETFSTFAEHDPRQFDFEFHFLSQIMAPHLKSFSSHLETMFTSALDITSDTKYLLRNAFLSFGAVCRNHSYFYAAKTYLEYALQICNDGSEDEDEAFVRFIATTRNSLGVVYLEIGNFEKAKEQHQNALALLERLQLENPTSEVADSLNKLGNVFYSLGQFEEAKEYFHKSLKIREALFGNEHADVAASLCNLGVVHSVLDDLETAENFFQRSLALREMIYGKVHPDMADSLTNLGNTYGKLGLFDKAIQYHKQALEMRQKLFFPDHMMISESYNNLGLAYTFVGQLQETRFCYETALRIREKILDKDHPAIAGLLSNLGVLYMDLDELEKSKDFHNRALQIRIKVLGPNHCKVGDCMLNLGLVHERCNAYGVAESYFQQAVNLYAGVYPTNHMMCKSAAEGLRRVSYQVETLHSHYGSVESVDYHQYSTRSAANHAEYRKRGFTAANLVEYSAKTKGHSRCTIL